MNEKVKNRYGLRVLSRGGGCDSWVEVRAYTAAGACRKALFRAATRNPQFGKPGEWKVTYLLLMDTPASLAVGTKVRSRERSRVK